MDPESPPEPPFIFEQNKLSIESMQRNLQEYRKSGLFCDVILKVGDQEIPAHRNILAATIPYFNSMFTSDYLESNQKEIVIRDIDPLALEALIDFSYKGKIEIDDSRNVQELMSAAVFVGLDQVKNACSEHLASEIQVENVLEIAKLADQLNCKNLTKAADKFIKSNFLEIAETNEFLMLEFEEVKELIGKDDITCTEDEILEAAMKWVKFDDERCPLLPKILSNIRFSLVSTEILVNITNTEELIRSSNECLLIVDEAKNLRLTCTKGEAQRSRGVSNFDNLIPAVIANQLKFYDAMKNEWLDEEISVAEITPDSAVVSLESKIYAIGDDLNIYDFKTKKMSKEAKSVNRRLGAGATVLNDCIYLCGGLGEDDALGAAVELYSVEENSWKELAPMLLKRVMMGVTSLNGSIYVIGGLNESRGPLNCCEKYDPTTNTWTYIQPLFARRTEMGIATLNNKIYVCGGQGGVSPLNSCEVFDLSTNCWSKIASMNEKRYNYSLKSVNGKLYAVGGQNVKGDLSVEVYSPETNSWEIVM